MHAYYIPTLISDTIYMHVRIPTFTIGKHYYIPKYAVFVRVIGYSSVAP